MHVLRDGSMAPRLNHARDSQAVICRAGSLIDKETGCFKTAAELADIFAGIDAEKPVVTTCGSGVTACGLALGLAMIGREDVAIYDGSWSEWGSRPECPVAV